MSQSSNRPSLIGLKATLPAVPRVAPVPVSAQIEEQILGGDPRPALGAEGKAAAAERRPASRKEPTVLMNAKLPAALHTRLKRTAQFNDISMTDILIRALETELSVGPYATPPENWGGEKGT